MLFAVKYSLIWIASTFVNIIVSATIPTNAPVGVLFSPYIDDSSSTTFTYQCEKRAWVDFLHWQQESHRQLLQQQPASSAGLHQYRHGKVLSRELTDSAITQSKTLTEHNEPRENFQDELVHNKHQNDGKSTSVSASSGNLRNGHNGHHGHIRHTVSQSHHHPNNMQMYYHLLQQRDEENQHNNPQQHQMSDRDSTFNSQSSASSETPMTTSNLRGHHHIKYVLDPAFPFNCTSLPKTRHNRWLLAESSSTGLCNQLFGVYSYIAAAFYYNSSLIVDGLYSRTSFEHEWPLIQTEWTTLPFSSFFDWYHFSNFWKIRGLEMIEGHQYRHCPEPPERLKPINLIRDPPYWPYDFQTKMKMLAFNNLTNPLPENIIMTLIADQKFVTFGFLYEFPALMIDIFLSLQPAPILAKFIRLIQHRLLDKFAQPSKTKRSSAANSTFPYIVAHLRVENDFHGVGDFDGRRDIHRDAVKFLINNNTCLASWPRDPKNPNKLINPPPLVLSSGLWANRVNLQETMDSFGQVQKNNAQSEDDMSLQDFTLHLFYEAGFRTILTKETIIYEMEMEQKQYLEEKEKRAKEEADLLVNEGNVTEYLLQNRSDKVKEAKFQADSERFKDYFDFIPYHTLLPEQLAMIDLFISRHAPCFCPAHVHSTFSYWVLRMKAFAEHKHLHIAEINAENYGLQWVFAGWGV